MTQPLHSAKRSRSNTSSHDFTNVAPQTTAPALRQSNSQANLALYDPSAVSAVAVSGSSASTVPIQAPAIASATSAGNAAHTAHVPHAASLYDTNNVYGQISAPSALEAQVQAQAQAAHVQAQAYGTFAGSGQNHTFNTNAFGGPAPTAFATSTDPYDLRAHTPAQSNPFVPTYATSISGSSHSASYPYIRSRPPSSAGPASYSPSPAPPSSRQSFHQSQQSQQQQQHHHHHHHHQPSPLQSHFGESYHNPSDNLSTPLYIPNGLSLYSDSALGAQFSPSFPQTPATGHHESPTDFPDDLHEDHDDEDDQELDAQGDLDPDSSEEEILPIKSEPDHEQPLKPPDFKCTCKKGRGRKKACETCVCSKYGNACTDACSCGPVCGNPFQNLTVFFGPLDRFPQACGPNPCFSTWLLNQPNVEELDAELLIDVVTDDDKSWDSIKKHIKPFKEWETKWNKSKNAKARKSRDDREVIEFELLRGALGNCNQDNFHGYSYSFCEGAWVLSSQWKHCTECRVCRPNNEWHCDEHKRCSKNGVCAGCAGPYQQHQQRMVAPAMALQ